MNTGKEDEIEIKLNLDEDDESNISNDEVDQPDELEIEAKSMGWVPQEEWEGPKHKWRPAKEFVDRSSFFRKIEKQNQIIQEQNQALKKLADLQKNIAQSERVKVLAELNAQKKQAFEDQDFEAATQIDDQILAIRSAPEPAPIQIPDVEVAQAEHPDFAAFKERNQWFERDPDLRDLAETLAGGYAVKMQQQGKQVNPKEMFEYIEKQVRKQTKMVPDPVESTTRRAQGNGSKKSKFTYNDLDSIQKGMAKRFVQLGAFENEQEYVDALVAAGDLK